MCQGAGAECLGHARCMIAERVGRARHAHAVAAPLRDHPRGLNRSRATLMGASRDRNRSKARRGGPRSVRRPAGAGLR
jgi:hypothetical protein